MNDFPKQLSLVLNSAARILVTGPQSPSVDALSTAAAWAVFLAGQKKNVDIAFSGQIKKLPFIPKDVKIENQIKAADSFKIILDVSKTKVDELSYNIEDDKLVIDIVPQNGSFKSEDIKTESGNFPYDLVIVLGAHELGQLGEIYHENKKMFSGVSIVNIDNSIINENYGQLNIVRPQDTSLGELCYELLKNNLSQPMATCLLAGMISATNSFQSSRVTPQTLSLASELIIKGADRESIIHALYRTKDISTLKNWGKILSRLNKKESVIVSHLKYDEVDGLPHHFAELARELILATPRVHAVVIYYQSDLERTQAWIYTKDNIDAQNLVKELEGTGSRNFAEVFVDQDLESAKEELTDFIEQKLRLMTEQ